MCGEERFQPYIDFIWVGKDNVSFKKLRCNLHKIKCSNLKYTDEVFICWLTHLTSTLIKMQNILDLPGDSTVAIPQVLPLPPPPHTTYSDLDHYISFVTFWTSSIGSYSKYPFAYGLFHKTVSLSDSCMSCVSVIS